MYIPTLPFYFYLFQNRSYLKNPICENQSEYKVGEREEMLKIYVLHYTKLTDRKSHIDAELKKHNLTCEFIEVFDQEVLSKEDLSLFRKNLRLSEKSLTLKHKYAYEKIVKEHDFALIFEDDVILDDQFFTKMAQYIEELKRVDRNWDMLFIGNGCNLHIPSKEIVAGKCIYAKSHGNGATRCTDSYLIHKKCAQKLLDYMKDHTFDKPIDWWLNDALRNIDAKVYWCEPTIVKQGTQHKKFKSSIR